MLLLFLPQDLQGIHKCHQAQRQEENQCSPSAQKILSQIERLYFSASIQITAAISLLRWGQEQKNLLSGVMEIFCQLQICIASLRTQRILKVFLPHQFEVLLDGFGGQGVLPEDEVLIFPAPVHLGHHQIRQEVLREQNEQLQLGGGEYLINFCLLLPFRQHIMIHTL